ncbi:MAG: hypothetical protein ABSA84_04385 [Gammaproteobacteria bacterium]
MEVINNTEIKIKTLTLSQLLDRPGWQPPQCSIENIYELSEIGNFGLYWKPSKINGHNKRKTHKTIIEYLENCIEKADKVIDVSMKNDSFLKKKEKYINFLISHKNLLVYKSGYVRLAVAAEIEMFSLCENGSVRFFKENSGINGSEFNNYFGFVFNEPSYDIPEKKCISPAYYFYQRSIMEDDLFVFTEEIEEFERTEEFKKIRSPLILNQSNITKNKNSFLKYGDCYTITFNHISLPPIKITVGLKYIEFLLKNPDKEFSINDIYNHCNPMSPEAFININKQQQYTQQINDTPLQKTDKKTIKSAKQRLEDIGEEIEDAKEQCDIVLTEDLEEERNNLMNYIKKNSYKNKINTSHDTHNLGRIAVKKAIVDGIERIGKHSSELQEHLEKYIDTGSKCSYKASGIEW